MYLVIVIVFCTVHVLVLCSDLTVPVPLPLPLPVLSLGATYDDVLYALERQSRLVRVSRIRTPGKDAYLRLRGKVAVAGRCRKPSSLIFAHAPLSTVQMRQRQHHDEPTRADTRRYAGTARRYSIQTDASQDTVTRDSFSCPRRRATTATWTRATTVHGEQKEATATREFRTWHGEQEEATGYSDTGTQGQGTTPLQLQ